MLARVLLLLGVGLVIVGCATPMAMRDIEAVKPSCARIDKQIAALEHEKAQNDQRVFAGVQSVAPALVVLNLVGGTYGTNVAIATGSWAAATNVAIATGSWAAAIDRKAAELRRAKKSC